MRGTLAQLVEQRTENPCVPGSIPGGTTNPINSNGIFIFLNSQSFFYISCVNQTLISI